VQVTKSGAIKTKIPTQLIDVKIQNTVNKTTSEIKFTVLPHEQN